MLYERQKHLLALAECPRGRGRRAGFSEAASLYCLEVEASPSYEFVPYKFGGFSFTSYADKRGLIGKGLLADENRIWKLTPKGKVVPITVPILTAMNRFAKRHAGLRGDALVAEAYRRHPYYAIRSEIKEQVLAGDTACSEGDCGSPPIEGKPGTLHDRL